MEYEDLLGKNIVIEAVEPEQGSCLNGKHFNQISIWNGKCNEVSKFILMPEAKTFIVNGRYGCKLFKTKLK